MAVVLLRTAVSAEQEAPKPDGAALVAAAVRSLDGVTADEPVIWSKASALAALGKDMLPELRKAAAAEQSIAAKLALGRALLSLQDFAAGIRTLSSVITSDADVRAKVAAARLLGTLGRDAAEVELARPLDITSDDIVRVALAESLGLAATTEQAETKATTVLVRLVRGGSSEVRAAAALALAQSDDFRDPVPAVLKELASEPTTRGRLAGKLLELKRLSDLMLREKEYAGSLGHPLLDEIKDKIIQYHIEPPPKEEALVDAAARGMAAYLHANDPYSSYMSAREWGEFREHISGTYGGIGAHVMFLKDDRTGEKVFTAVKPIYSGPAYKAGLRSYDQFVEIDGVDVKGKSAEELRNMLRGLPDSVVACKIRRRGAEKDEEFLLKIIRGHITVPSVRYELLPGGIGYLGLESFGDTSAAEVEAALREMEKDDRLKALIFDLRDNPGGLMNAAQEIADKFLKDDKLIVYSEGRNKEIAPRKEMRTTEPATHPDFPVIVLVNGNTASAAEIVSGALQDHKRALLIGERTFGKGSVQQIMRLDSAGRQAVLKLTIARYFLPSGRSVHRMGDDRGGIIPDIEQPFEPSWTPESFEKQRAAGDFYRYSLIHWPKHKETLQKLAAFDREDPSLYPGFDEWFDGLRLKTDRDSARRLLRQWLRVLTADERGRDWACDLQEDNQLQRGVYEAARQVPGLDLRAVLEYKGFVDRIEKRPATAPEEK